ncbi:hypothetical protein F5B18DRAFT_279399 [Nemania serpens]|nr:hypothetical protein F5B18DRAFT_279399 [Nemania serpens]
MICILTIEKPPSDVLSSTELAPEDVTDIFTMPEPIPSDGAGSGALEPVPSNNPATSDNSSAQQALSVGLPTHAATLPRDPVVSQAYLQARHTEYVKVLYRSIKCGVCGRKWAPCLQMCRTCRFTTCVNCHNSCLYHHYHVLAKLGLDWSYRQVVTRQGKRPQSDNANPAQSSAKKAKTATTTGQQHNNNVPGGPASRAGSATPMALSSSIQIKAGARGGTSSVKIEAAVREGTSRFSNALTQGSERRK